MRSLVVYESMYGATHTVADHVADGLRPGGEVEVVPVGEATSARLAWADLVVVGGPTHMHSMTTSRSRELATSEEALATAHDKGDDLELDPDAEGPGLREWFHRVEPERPTMAAAFDTRFHGPAALTGRASKGIRRRLRHHGYDVLAEPESFLVGEDNTLDTGETDRAERWGRTLLDAVAARSPASAEGGATSDRPGSDALDRSLESGGRYAPPRRAG